ncbi:tigger transposable element-derived protein 6-like [Dermacentor andersoni]|uniref:tigger transposable element-derived protein 6-like n=1 Tax=Dermacentor andersoni TaxID=34620 RepID=UPI003B3B9C5D
MDFLQANSAIIELQESREQHSIVGKVASGESAEANSIGAADWLCDRVPGILSRYNVSDIYNADETAFFYRLLPRKTLALRNEKCHGGKHSKQRLTVLLCVNMDGSDKRVPFVIGTSEKPHCFSGKRSMPVKYAANTKACMTRDLFSNWLKDLDAEMHKRGRNICLLLDNCSAHHVQDCALSNIELEYFLANCTSLIQPLDQRIINSIKCAYRKQVIERLLLNIELHRETKIDVFMALEMLSRSCEATNMEIVAKCFRKAGLKESVSLNEEAECRANDGDEGMAYTTDVVDSWQLLCDQGGAPRDMTPEDFVFSDACAVTTEELDDDAVIQSITNTEMQDDDSDEELQAASSIATPKQVMDALDLLRTYAGAHSQEQALAALPTYERLITPTLIKERQMKLTEFFAST